MSAPSKILCIVFGVLFALGAYAATPSADVTGSFETSISVRPPRSAERELTEEEQLTFDIQNSLDFSFAVSGLTTTLHSHFGIAGIEDALLTTEATLGALDIKSELVFSRFAGYCAFPGWLFEQPEMCFFVVNNPNPLSSKLLFVKKRVTSQIRLGGVNFENLAMYEDVTYPQTFFKLFIEAEPEALPKEIDYGSSDQNFAFGDVLTIQGETPSGISVTSETGICAEQSPNVIKKHSFPFKVNSACADLALSFENSFIEGSSAPTGAVPKTETESVNGVAVEESVTYADDDGDGEVSHGDTITKTFTLTRDSAHSVQGDEVAITNSTLLDDQCTGQLLSPGESCQIQYAISFDDEGTAETSTVEIGFSTLGPRKPAVLFDFEELLIVGVPLAPDVRGNASIFCQQVSACQLKHQLSFSNGPIPVEVSLLLTDLFGAIEFGNAMVQIPLGAGTLTFLFDSTFSLSAVLVHASLTLNPDAKPATLSISAGITPGEGIGPGNTLLPAMGTLGLDALEVDLSVVREGMMFRVGADWDGLPATFEDVTFGVKATAGAFDIESSATFTNTGLDSARTSFRIGF